MQWNKSRRFENDSKTEVGMVPARIRYFFIEYIIYFIFPIFQIVFRKNA